MRAICDDKFARGNTDSLFARASGKHLCGILSCRSHQLFNSANSHYFVDVGHLVISGRAKNKRVLSKGGNVLQVLERGNRKTRFCASLGRFE